MSALNQFFKIAFTHLNRVDSHSVIGFGNQAQALCYVAHIRRHTAIWDYVITSINSVPMGLSYGAELVDLTVYNNVEIKGPEHNPAEISQYHYFLTEAIIGKLPEGQNLGDLFGMGEDSFVLALYEHAMAFYLEGDRLFRAGGDFPGVVVYDITDELAECFWAMVEDLEELPEVDAFALDVARVYEKYLIR